MPVSQESFQQLMGLKPFTNPGEMLDVEPCRNAVLAIERDLQQKVFGQAELIRYLLMAMTLQEHLLIEGLPGEGKTYSVEHLASITRTTHTWLQGRPDIVTSDVVGKQILTVDSKGTPKLRFLHGPVFSNLLIFDEINRAPGKIQAMLLLVMQNREVTDPRNGKKIPVIHPIQRRDLQRTRAGGATECYGIPIPDPAHDKFSRWDVRQTVIATQNPIELEGTYPLPEAQTDRFAFFVNVIHPEIGAYVPILLKLLMTERQQAPNRIAPPAINPADARTIPMWIRLNCLFDCARRHAFQGAGSIFGRLLGLGNNRNQQGLLHRVLLLIYFTRWRHPSDDGLGEHDEVLRSQSDPIVDRVEGFLREWLRSDEAALIRAKVESMLVDRRWEYVQWGVSARGLLSLISAGVVSAFLDGRQEVNRSDFRQNVQATLTHRIGMTTRAEAERVTSEQILDLLCDTFLPLEEGDESKPLIPPRLLQRVIPRELIEFMRTCK